MHLPWEFFHSRASLENVEQICLFYGDRGRDNNCLDRCCLGILLTYSNGRQEALGQCRIGLSQTATFKNPTALYCRRILLAEYGSGIIIRVTPGDMDVNKPNRDDWIIIKMKGMLRWWFNYGRTLLDVEVRGI